MDSDRIVSVILQLNKQAPGCYGKGLVTSLDGAAEIRLARIDNVARGNLASPPHPYHSSRTQQRASALALCFQDKVT